VSGITYVSDAQSKNKRLRKLKGQSRLDNPENLVTQDEDKKKITKLKQTQKRPKKTRNLKDEQQGPTKNRVRTQVLGTRFKNQNIECLWEQITKGPKHHSQITKGPKHHTQNNQRT
jgi:hypothetical protein